VDDSLFPGNDRGARSPKELRIDDTPGTAIPTGAVRLTGPQPATLKAR
jgi:hypothetical protein